MRIVVSLTTLPNRYDYLIKTIDSITSQSIQPEKIYITIPEIAKRSGLPYPPLPPSVMECCEIVKIPIDYGPICKLYGALLRESHSDTMIFTIDDDVIYPPTFIEVFLQKHHLNKNCAITGTGVLVGHGVRFLGINTTMTWMRAWNGIIGFSIPPEGREVDIVQGFSGCLYKRGFFPIEKKIYKKLLQYTEDIDIFKSDDILISAYLNKHDVKIRTYDFNKEMDAIKPCLESPDALSGDFWKMVQTFSNALEKLTTWGFFKTWAPFSPNESLVIKVPIFAIAMIAIFTVFLFCIYAFYCRYYDVSVF